MTSSREEQAPTLDSLRRYATEASEWPFDPASADRYYQRMFNLAGDVLRLIDDENALHVAFHHACAEVARWRAWYGFADFGLTEAPDEQVQDVQQEFLGKARGVGA